MPTTCPSGLVPPQGLTPYPYIHGRLPFLIRPDLPEGDFFPASTGAPPGTYRHSSAMPEKMKKVATGTPRIVPGNPPLQLTIAGSPLKRHPVVPVTSTRSSSMQAISPNH